MKNIILDIAAYIILTLLSILIIGIIIYIIYKIPLLGVFGVFISLIFWALYRIDDRGLL